VLLVDTSAWVEFLRATGSPAHHEVRRLLRERPTDVATTQPVVMELLAGASDPARLARLERLTAGLRMAAIDADLDFHAAAAVYRAARQRGETVRRLLGCLIAAIAVRTGATLVHRDRDLDVIGSCLPELRLRSLR
jgi:predicted nucleic acid-binding protein